MKKIIYSVLCGLLFSHMVQAQTLGTEVKQQIPSMMYSECMKNAGFSDITQLLAIPKYQLCSCISDEVTKSFIQANIEQRMNSGSLTIKQFFIEMENLSEKAGEICVEKFFKG